MKKFYKGYIDAVFKAIFCKDTNEELLSWLLKRSLKEDIEIIKIMPPEVIKPNIYVRNKTLDVLVRLKGKLTNIEVNSGYYTGLHERNAAFIFSKYSEETKVGESYSKMVDVIQINFTRGLSNKYPSLSIYTLTDVKAKINYINNLKIYEYNVDKIFDECYNKNNKEFNFVAMLDSDENQLKKICEGDEMMEKFENEINKLNDDVEFTTWLSAEEDARKVNNTLIVNAKDEGIKESQIETAKNLLSKGMKVEEVIDVLNVENKDTKNEIKILSKQVKKLNQDQDILDVITRNEDELIRNTLYEKAIQKGISKGISQGIEKNKIEVAKNLLKMKMNLNDISKATGLSKDEIIKLKEV